MPFEIRFTDKALKQIRSQIQWISIQSTQGTERWKEAFDRALTRIEENGDTIGLAPECVRYREQVREIFFKTPSGRNYRIVFLIRGHLAFVIGVRGPGQRLLDPRTTRLPPE